MNMNKLKILWVDDDVNNPELRSDKDMLESIGCEITAVESVEKLMQIINNEEGQSCDFDIIILDLSMPTGSLELSETQFGTRTGKVLLDRLMNSRLKDVKKIVYTIVDAAEVREYCSNNSIPYWSKADYTSREFAKNVINSIQK